MCHWFNLQAWSSWPHYKWLFITSAVQYVQYFFKAAIIILKMWSLLISCSVKHIVIFDVAHWLTQHFHLCTMDNQSDRKWYVICNLYLPVFQESRVQESMRRVDQEGVSMRTFQLHTARRRKYSVPAPNSLWYIDGNHKLIRSELANVNNTS